MPPSPRDEPLEPVSDEELQRHRLQPLVPHNAPITLAPYDPAWPDLFAREAARIRGALGATALRIEHVGSTSVPGMSAKPVIDIVLAVPDPADEPSYLPALEAAGYHLFLREPAWYEHRLIRGPDTAVNLHVFAPDSPEIPRMLRFRDLLRTDPTAFDRYLHTKQDLARRTWRHVQHYADAKTGVIREILDEPPTGQPT